MNPSSQSNSLTDAEIETLEERLSAIDPDDSMAVEELDGFCAALACSPEPIAREEWLPRVLGELLVHALMATHALGRQRPLVRDGEQNLYE